MPIQSDSTIHHFPFMVYLPCSFTLNFLLFIIAGILLRKNEGAFKTRSDNWRILKKCFDQFQWEEKPALWRKIFRWIAIIAFVASIFGFFLIGIVAPPYLFSPMNMFFLPFAFGTLSVWISMGVRNENIRIALYLFMLLIIYLGIEILALIIAHDELAIPIITIFHINAPILIGIRLLSFIFIRKKK